MRLFLPVLLLIASCHGTHHYKPADLGGIYSRAAKYHGLERNPIIVIPGVMGSKLKDGPSGRVVWGAFSGDYANPTKPDGARLFALPMREGASLAALSDDVSQDGALDTLEVSILGLPITLNAYAEMLVALGAGGYADQTLGESGAVDYGDDHFTCFQFAYDWRRDNVENAKRLHAFILDKRKYVQKELEKRFGKKDHDVKFDIVAHSMGGLVSRYFLRYGDADLPADGSEPSITWAGARYVERAILVGTPNAGSAEGLSQLIEGRELASILPKYEPALIGTLPSVYQLLPRTRHGALRDGERTLDIFDPRVWESRGWGLADPAQDEVLRLVLPNTTDAAARRRIALDHQRKCLARAKRFAAALDAPARPPAGTELFLIAGDAESTLAVVNTSGKPAYAPGDGTVTRQSALADERADGNWTPTLRSPITWSGTTFLFRDHLGLTKDPMFTDNVLFLLLEDPRE